MIYIHSSTLIIHHYIISNVSQSLNGRNLLSVKDVLKG